MADMMTNCLSLAEVLKEVEILDSVIISESSKNLSVNSYADRLEVVRRLRRDCDECTTSADALYVLEVFYREKSEELKNGIW